MTITPWYGFDGKPLSHADGGRLLADIESRLVAEDVVRDGVELALVTTLFTVTDHGTMEGGPPVLWETAVFGGPMDHYVEHYATSEEAERRHAEIVQKIRRMMAVPARGHRRHSPSPAPA